MTSGYNEHPMSDSDIRTLKKMIHKALVDARIARYCGNEEEVKKIVREIIAKAAPAAYKARLENGAFNWVIEALKPLDELLLPDDESLNY